jgi:deazaflavin-dependent oxidoreductase (nitroreductase family)
MVKPRIHAEGRVKMSKQTSSIDSMARTRSDNKNEKAPTFMLPIFKLPIFLYQLKLGWLLGTRFMQITHVGRRSGKVRRTILAVLRFDEKSNEIFAVSAWKGSDWYCNIQALPALQVETGFVGYVPQQRTLSPEEITTAFLEYRRQHPIFSRMICRIPGWKWDSSYEEFLELARTLRGVAFKPK